MYRVLIVDDEPINYQLLEKLVKWEEKGFEIVGFAGDGMEAIRKYEELAPELILMDIQLPLMDGLECTRHIRQYDDQVRIIIISAYGDFSYAQKAIRYGVQDFLLKPVSRLMLNQLVDKMKEELDAQSQKTAQSRQSDLVRGFLAYLESEHKEEGELSGYDWFGISCVDESGYYADDGRRSALMDRIAPALSAVIPQGRGKIVAGAPKGRSGPPKLLRMLAQEKETCQIYVRPEEMPLRAWVKKFEQCENYGFYGNARNVYEITDDFFQNRSLHPESLNRYLLDAILSGEDGPLYAGLEELFARAKKERCRPGDLKETALDVLISLKLLVKKFAQEDSAGIIRNLSVESIYDVQTSDGLYRFLEKTLRDGLREIRALFQRNDSHLVFRTNAYTEKYYCEEDFSTQMAADFNNISKNYFIRLYKEQAGIGYWEYVTSLRMEKAKELLLTTEELGSTVAQMVGYRSEYHFSRKFKEYTGQSPNAFRKSAAASK